MPRVSLRDTSPSLPGITLPVLPAFSGGLFHAPEWDKSSLLCPQAGGSQTQGTLMLLSPFIPSYPIQTISTQQKMKHLEHLFGTSLVVQWLKLRAPNAGGLGSIPGQGTGSHMRAATKSSHATIKRRLPAATKTWLNQVNKKKKKKKKKICLIRSLPASQCPRAQNLNPPMAPEPAVLWCPATSPASLSAPAYPHSRSTGLLFRAHTHPTPSHRRVAPMICPLAGMLLEPG